MVKIPISSTKYVIVGNFNVEGIIEKTDLIGSFFGQTEGLVGEELEFASLQKTGKLGRIEINIKKDKGITYGTFEIPNALNKIEVSILAAAIESITKIGHTNGKITIKEIRDERQKKREQILKRAEELLESLKEELPESANIAEKVDINTRIKQIRKYGSKYFGGPNILREKEIILVEGRADVINLIKNGIFNVISFDGSNFDEYIINICKHKEITLFLDDDKAGHAHLDELKENIKIKFYTFAPNGLEVEDLTLKEINKALKNKQSCNKEKIINNVKKIKHIFYKQRKSNQNN